jgi:carbonic anhydrase
MNRLLQGYARFRRDVFPEMKDHFHLLADTQNPDILFITCADSRVVPNLIFQSEPGDLFISRVIGNVIPPFGQMAGGISATVEYAVEVLHVRHIIVCGHSDCGAIKAAIAAANAPAGRPEKLARLPLTAKWLGYVESAWKHLPPGIPRNEPGVLEVALIRANVVAQIENLKTHPEVASALAHNALQVHGWYYDILTGAIEAWEEQENRFIPLEELSAREK